MGVGLGVGLLAQCGERGDDAVEVRLVQAQADRVPARAHLLRRGLGLGLGLGLGGVHRARGRGRGSSQPSSQP